MNRPHVPGDPVGAVAGYFPNLEATKKPDGIFLDKPARPPEGMRKGGHDGEYGCRVPANGKKRCPQCWLVLAFPDSFDGKHNCNFCRRDQKVIAKPAPCSERRHLSSIADLLDAVHRWVEARTTVGAGKLSPEERDLLGSWHRYQTQRMRPVSVPPPAGFSAEEATTKTAPKEGPGSNEVAQGTC